MTVPDAHSAAMRRCRRVIHWINRHRPFEWLPFVLIAAIVVVAWRGESQDREADQAAILQQRRSDERDAARAFQRCEQQRPTILVVSTALDEYPGLRARVRAEHPEALDSQGRLTAPDCTATYPLGAAVSHRYPDVAPTTPTARSTP